MAYRQWEIPLDEVSETQRAGLAYWRSLPSVADSAMPAVADFDLMRLPYQSLPTTHVVDVLNDGNDFRYRFWGSGFRDYFGYDATGQSTETLMPVDIREPVRAAYRTAAERRQPMALLSEFQRGTTAPQQGFQRFLRLPLAASDGSVERIVSLVEFLMAEHEAQKFIEQITAASTTSD